MFFITRINELIKLKLHKIRQNIKSFHPREITLTKMISLKTLKRQVSILKNGNKMSQNIFCSSSADINPSDIVLKTALSHGKCVISYF